jgi:hypothetical protein
MRRQASSHTHDQQREGGAYVGITPGAAAAYLRSGSNMQMTESAFSLEHLMKGLSAQLLTDD